MSFKRCFTAFTLISVLSHSAMAIVPSGVAQAEEAPKTKKPTARSVGSAGKTLGERATPEKLGVKGDGGPATEANGSTSRAASNGLRLPKHFSQLVDQRQRQSIQQIQAEYREKISQLQEALAQAKRDELQAIEQLLTPTQRRLLQQRREQSMQASSQQKAAEDSSMLAESDN
jgi:ABC-type Na+ efflux pump permease subunit